MWACALATIKWMAPNTEPQRTRIGQSGDADPGSPGPGTLLDGRYRLGKFIGQGGSATVFRGTDDLLGRTIAIKVFEPHLTDPVMIARQRQEMRLMASLQHPHLVAVYDARIAEAPSGPTGVTPGYLVLEFMGGPSLAAQLQQGPMTPEEVSAIGVGIASALAVVHREGFVHRDIKPANILLTTTGEPKLSDFGIARVLSAERITQSGDVLGTAPYLSPEQVRGEEIGSAADVYALGLVLLECLTGRREYPGPAVEAAVARLHREPVIPDALPRPWQELLRAMTDVHPGDRPTAAAAASALAGTADRESAPPIAPFTSQHTRPLSDGALADGRDPDRTGHTLADAPRRRKRRPTGMFVAAVAGLLICVAALVAVILIRDDNPTTTSPGVVTSSGDSQQPTAASTVDESQPVLVTATGAPAEPSSPSTSAPAEPTPPESVVPPTTVEPAGQTPTTENGSGGNRGNGNGGNQNPGNGNGNGGNGNGNGGNENPGNDNRNGGNGGNGGNENPGNGNGN